MDELRIKKILMCGTPRSGTTFLTQVIKKLTNHSTLNGKIQVQKTHGYSVGSHNPAVWKLLSYRDPRDVICSYANSILLREIESGVIPSDPEATRYFIATHRLFLRPQAYQLDFRAYRWEHDVEGLPVTFIKYEDWFPFNTQSLVEHLVPTLKNIDPSYEISDEDVRRIVDDSSFMKNKKVKFMRTGKSVWRETLLSLPPQQAHELAYFMDQMCGDFIIELGYEKDRSWKEQFKSGTVCWTMGESFDPKQKTSGLSEESAEDMSRLIRKGLLRN